MITPSRCLSMKSDRCITIRSLNSFVLHWKLVRVTGVMMPFFAFLKPGLSRQLIVRIRLQTMRLTNWKIMYSNMAFVQEIVGLGMRNGFSSVFAGLLIRLKPIQKNRYNNESMPIDDKK